jgi:hypothetical protein
MQITSGQRTAPSSFAGGSGVGLPWPVNSFPELVACGELVEPSGKTSLRTIFTSTGSIDWLYSQQGQAVNGKKCGHWEVFSIKDKLLGIW